MDSGSGRARIPDVESNPREHAVTERFHAVRFYRDVDGLSRVVGDYIAKGLADAQSAVIIATPLHRSQIEKRLADNGVDVGRLQARGLLTLFDAETTLAAFMRN